MRCSPATVGQPTGRGRRAPLASVSAMVPMTRGSGRKGTFPPWTAGRIHAKSHPHLDAREAPGIPSRPAFTEGTDTSLRRRLQQRSEAAESARTAERIRRVLLRRPAREGIDEILPLDEVEHAYIVAALQLCRGNQSLTATRLGIGRSTLLRRIRSLKLRRMLRELDREKAAQRARAPRARPRAATKTRKRARPSSRLARRASRATRARRRR